MKNSSRVLVVFRPYYPLQLSGKVLDSPKSHSFMLQEGLRRMFAGFRSLWSTFASWMNAIAQRVLYTILIKFYSLKLVLCFNSWLTSCSINSITKHNWFKLYDLTFDLLSINLMFIYSFSLEFELSFDFTIIVLVSF